MLGYTIFDKPVYHFLTYKTFSDGFGFILMNMAI